MFQTFLRLAEAAPDAVAVIGDVPVTRADLLRRAAGLASAGIEPRSLIAIQLPNGPDFVAAVLAIAKEDAVAILIDRDAAVEEVRGILDHFGARGLIQGSGLIHRSQHEQPAIPAGARVMKLTSGSTGKPKGIIASDANLMADASQICATMGIGSDDVNFGAIPMSHSFGFSNLVMPLIAQGTAIVISNDYLPRSIIDRCNRYACTVLPGIPMMFEHLASTAGEDGDFQTVRTFLSAGAPLTAAVSRRFRERFGRSIHSFYGCSECGGIAYDRQGAAAERGHVGPAMENVTLKAKSSRLLVESAAVSLGYLIDARTFEPFESGRFLADDLVEIDSQCNVTLTGRASDLTNTAGKKVNPREVEHVILQMEGVRQAKVYGEPAGARGEVVAVAIVASPDVTRDDVRAFCRERLSSHKVPRIVKLIESIPLDDRGKVSRSALASL